MLLMIREDVPCPVDAGWVRCIVCGLMNEVDVHRRIAGQWIVCVTCQDIAATRVGIDAPGRAPEAIYADMESTLRSLPQQDSARLLVLAGEMAEQKALHLFDVMKQNLEAGNANIATHPEHDPGADQGR
jgi:hypothetical protein